MPVRSNKTLVKLIYLSHGVVAFQVPALTEGHTVRLWFGKGQTGIIASDLFAGRRSVFKDMIRNAFPNEGGITLNGYLTPFTGKDDEQPVFRTVIQPDADVLCHIDRSVLKRDDFRQLLYGYDRVRHQFLEAFRHRIRFFVMQIIAVCGGGLSLWGILEMFSWVFGK